MIARDCRRAANRRLGWVPGLGPSLASARSVGWDPRMLIGCWTYTSGTNGWIHRVRMPCPNEVCGFSFSCPVILVIPLSVELRRVETTKRQP